MRPARRLLCVGCVLSRTGTMYRTFTLVIVCVISVTAAPKDDKNSDITYVKIQPVTEDVTPPKPQHRESRIENLPLTIGNKNLPNENGDLPGRIHPDRLSNRSDSIVNPPIIDNNPSVSDNNPIISDNQPDNDRIEPDGVINNDDNLVENLRRVRSDGTTSSYDVDTVEPTEGITESLKELVPQTEEYETRTRAPSPRFLSKLSYFQKNEDVRNPILTNLLERTGKRGFKSKCRCEKIWNCPKLQITVPRCPNEYFLCC